MSILSIQSHVSFGYVGNKAAVYPLQSMGHDVWPINTVQFSNHTGYKKWKGSIFSGEEIENIAIGIEEIGEAGNCKAILSGYMGSKDICFAVSRIVERYRSINNDIVYLCDPVMGGRDCYVKPEVLDFFKDNLKADIITPNQHEAQVLSNVKIIDIESLKYAAAYFHDKSINIVVIKGIKFPSSEKMYSFVSSYGSQQAIIEEKEYNFDCTINGCGDLFSATYLGWYLKNKNPIEALQVASYMTQKALKNTFISQKKELQVISVKYDLLDFNEIPQALIGNLNIL